MWNFLDLNHQKASCKIRVPGRILVVDYCALECLCWYTLQLIEGKAAQLSKHWPARIHNLEEEPSRF